MNFLFFLVDPHAGALTPLGVGGFKGLRPLPPTPRKKTKVALERGFEFFEPNNDTASEVSNYPRHTFANSAIKKHDHLALRKKFAKPRFRLRIHHNA